MVHVRYFECGQIVLLMLKKASLHGKISLSIFEFKTFLMWSNIFQYDQK